MEAIGSGCHVFLTRDEALLRRRGRLAIAWISLLSPVEPTGHLVAASEGLLSNAGGGRLLPNTHKWQHVISLQEAESG